LEREVVSLTTITVLFRDIGKSGKFSVHDFVLFNRWFGPICYRLSQRLEILREPWFHGMIGAHQTLEKLSKGKVGSFSCSF